jgi:hypothetical protein
MQHDSKREEIADILENAVAVLEGLRARQGVPVGDVTANLRKAGKLLSELREPVWYPEIGTVTVGFEV